MDNDGGREREVSPGLWVSRRSFMAFCGVSIAAQAFVDASSAIADDAQNDFDVFLDAANATVEKLAEDNSISGQDRYLRTISSQASGLRNVPIPDEWRDSGQGDGPGTFIGFNPGGVGFVVLQWRMDPGTRILPHAHTYGNVVTVGLEGLTRVRNYEVVGPRDYRSNSEFIVRKTVDQILTPGSTNLVSLERDYIHGFDAGEEGSRGLDITTRLLPKPDFGVPYLSLDGQMRTDEHDRQFIARWRRV